MTPEGAPVVDLHSHLMPGVDDGVRDREEARQALAALAGAGVRRVAATPHLRASVLSHPGSARERLGELDDAWAALGEVAGAEAGAPAVVRGAEVRLDAPGPDLSDPRVRLGGGDAVLVEFGRLELPAYGAEQLREVAAAGWRPVLAHVERYRGIGARIGAAGRWRAEGAVLQVNAGSLLGQYGDEAERAGWEMLERGWVGVMASDYHGLGPVGLDGAADRLRGRDGGEAAELLLSVNPRRVLDGRPPLPVPPVKRPGLLRRVLALFG